MTHGRRISVVGLGYVGLPVAVAFGRTAPVIGFDINAERISELGTGRDRTNEVAPDDLAASDIHFTSDPARLAAADFHIVTVPTPINDSRRPDLTPLVKASTTLGGVLKRGDIVVYESTVYPGVTMEECVPILERQSGLAAGRDFTVGYSPERINPGDKIHRFETITKVVSGQDAATLDIVAAVYESVVTAGVHRAPTIAVAEAAKVIENTQRDVNIALMNELALIFNKLGIDTNDVLAAAGTKWNFLPFRPGLVGGHCIGVDPYYLTHRAEQKGYHPQVILSGRRINDDMGPFIARETIKALMTANAPAAKPLTGRPRVAVLGVTFKEDVPDVRNTRTVDIIAELRSFGAEVTVCDPLADPAEAEEEYGVALTPLADVPAQDAVILAVAHRDYLTQGWPLIERLLPCGGPVFDVKGRLDRTAAPNAVTLKRL